MNEGDLRKSLATLIGMLDDAHPGLATWHMIFRDRAVELRDELIRIYPPEKKK